ncbi:unnamed protein product (mitochondrion) [Plasmodiophora brassicae]|uniref:Large ribosomal subunit protein eL22 n=1 Tax=Plasmodiophora brassicae TaxID=37360 RepID=A0A0G4J665_PLABS|nr:hypothetical protein PBRA_002719 [Plasmodiophora brassicae]SPQ94871.1 unnamed protein product [Plasmodiophora brassicae]
MAVTKRKTEKVPAGKKSAVKLSINCEVPVADGIFDMAAFETYLNERIKINGKTGVLGDNVVLSRDGKAVNVQCNIQFSKRYLKYLTQKFLKKHQLRDYIRVIADTKTSYKLKYFSIEKKEDEGK